MTPSIKPGMRVAETCADCEAACLRAKARGFRPWRGAFACFEHAAVDWNDFCAEHGLTFEEAPAEQPDLFSTPQQRAA